MRPMPEARGAEWIGQALNSANFIGFVLFHEHNRCKFINLIHTPQENKIICSCSWQIINKMALKCY